MEKVELSAELVRDLFYLMRDILEVAARSNLPPQEYEKIMHRFNYGASHIFPNELDDLA
jgi:hypothetical protein